MLPTEEAFESPGASQALGQEVVFGLGPVPTVARTRPSRTALCCGRRKQCPRGCEAAVGAGTVHEWDQFLDAVDGCETLLVTGNYLQIAWCEGDARPKLSRKPMVCRHASLGVDGGRHGGLAGGHVDGEIGLLHQRHRHRTERLNEQLSRWISRNAKAGSPANVGRSPWRGDGCFPCVRVRGQRLADAGLSQFANVVVPEAPTRLSAT